MDEAKHTIAATERGLKKIEQRLGIEDIYADLSGQLVNHLQQALKAQYMFHRDNQYVVQNGEVKIVDEFTGRIMEAVVTPRACTRLSRQKRACLCARRIKRSPPSPCKTTSACTTSFPV